MNYRKMIKRKARISVKEHYGIWVVLCLVLMIIPAEGLWITVLPGQK